ncbi:ATP-binding protein [Streptomyces sp. NBC_01808]|uniref:AAA family ATPase n=1 Tax=Streptomyces sp. NBC_01808 TaxID=2975947 RepID=UPI002DD7DCEB|nr:ATP-binding protein [Streptomyces sp. NBC_01808]WSA41236.1 ATP-binding protein [Streptomyces sp. NBC_01808]
MTSPTGHPPRAPRDLLRDPPRDTTLRTAHTGRHPHTDRATLGELHVSAFKSHRGTRLGLGPVTLLTGGSGSGKTAALEACGVLARLGAGATLEEAFAPVPGGVAACVPQRAKPDAAGRRGVRLGCTVRGPLGDVRLDVAVQAEPELRIVGERLTGAGHTLLATALRDPRRDRVQASWHTGPAPVTRAPLPDDRLGTALLPLRIGGRTDGEQLVLAAAEQAVLALRSVYPCDPHPALMRAATAVPIGGEQLTPDSRNLPAVLRRVRDECSLRHAALVDALRGGCAGPVHDLTTEEYGDGLVRAVLLREPGRRSTPVETLGDGELRYLALALVLLTGPGVLAVDPASEVLPARQVLTVLADGLDRSLDARQARELVALSGRMGARGHIRVLGSVGDPSLAEAECATAVPLPQRRERTGPQGEGAKAEE